MTIAIGAFSVEMPMHRTAHSIVYRGRRDSDGLPVIVKATRGEHPSMSELARLRHEYSVLMALDPEVAPRALSLERFGNGLALVEEDVGARSLDNTYICGEAPDIETFLRIAIATSKAVEGIHRSKVIHKDIKPQHVFISEDCNHARLIDFGIATRLSEETSPQGLDTLEGSLSYMSPEQTGRLDRVIDRRSDLYSMGVTFYQLLTQTLPFDATDALELVHAHIAKIPVPPHQVREEVPAVLSEIVMKLLQKVAEDRYQEAGGLRADLERCLANHLATHAPLPRFLLGQRDASHELKIPQKLYGRDADAAALLSAFERALSGGPQLFLIAGAAGVGKSALVQDLRKRRAHLGRFIAGKFDPLNRNVPYAPVAHACGTLIRTLLTEPADALAGWRRKLLAALGPNGRVLIDVLPELELVVGAQPDVPALGPIESRNRFELVVQSFFGVFDSAERPLVFILEDLQWADPASLDLLKLLLANRGSHLLVIGSFRDDEVSPVHPLTLFLEALAGRTMLSRIDLKPLQLPHVSELLTDTLGANREWGELSTMVLRKTRGNPFFINQFMAKCFEDRLVFFDTDRREWDCRIEGIEVLVATDNVVDLLIAKLRRLSPKTQHAVQLAACIGQEFDALTLALISENGSEATAACLREALEAEIVVPTNAPYRHARERGEASATAPAGESLDAGYRLHERVRQAAYSMIPEADRAPIHLSIGRLLLIDFPSASGDAHIFEILGHINLALPHITDPQERSQLARLNLRAGKRARDASAPTTAIGLLRAALTLLGDDPWDTDCETAYQVHLILAECAYLNGDAEQTTQALDALDQHARGLERVPGRNLRALLLTNMGRLAEACEVSVGTMRMLGVEMPSPEDKDALRAATRCEFGAYQAARAGYAIEALGELPMMIDPTQLALITTFAEAIPAAFQSNQELMVLIVLKAVALPIRYGTAAESAFFYANYGIAHTVITGDRETSYRFGKLGIDIANRLGTHCSAGPVHFIFAGFLAHWCAPLSISLEHFKLGLRSSLEHGDLLHAGYCIGIGHLCRLLSGENLAALDGDLGPLVEIVARRNDVINGQLLNLSGQAIATLTGRTSAFGSLSGPDFDEASFEATAPPPRLAFYGAIKAMVRYMAGDYQASFEASEKFRALPGSLCHNKYKLYHALAAAQLARTATLTRRFELLALVRKDADCLKEWAATGPANNAHREALVRAELCALEGNEVEAMALYARATAEAEANGFLQHQALANELCGQFHLERGRPKVARAYLLDAHHAYERWGASAKARQLMARHCDLLQPGTSADNGASRPSDVARSTSGTFSGGGLDMESAMKATKAIAGELVLDRLIDRLLRILVENAGAQRGYLIVPRAGRLRIEASIAIDPDVVETGLDQDLEASTSVPAQVVQYVARSHQAVVLSAGTDDRFVNDPYMMTQRPKSLLCIALLYQGSLSAVLYLENSSATNVFSPARVERIDFLAAHAAVALQNAKLYAQVQAANETLEQKVEQRTQELAQRNRDMRLVLDNVNQGFLTIDSKGQLARERSDVVDTWFGADTEGCSFTAFCARFDSGFAEWFAVGFEALRDDFLPRDLCLDQLPASMKCGAREFSVTYFPILDGGRLDGLLIVINDITERIRRTREEAEHREHLAVFQAFTRDRGGLLTFFQEGQQMMRRLDDPALDASALKRILHTLKGNAALFGLTLSAQLCHEAEDRLFAGTWTGEALAPLRERWEQVTRIINVIIGERGQDVVEISQQDISRLVERVRQGAVPSIVAAELEAWRREPVERPLARLAEHGRALARRLGKGELRVEIEGNGVRAGMEESAALWSASVHLVNNAIDHGTESPAERVADGKPAGGHMRLAAHIQDFRLVIEVEDDGRGIDWTSVRRLAETRGLPFATRQDLTRALLAPEFSTRSNATSTSGRGVGLAAVHSQVLALGGTLELESEPNRGCLWRISIPCATIAAVALRTEASSPSV